MRPALRRSLRLAGIPEAEHHREGLLARFPPEFGVEESHLDDEGLAEVLLLFIRHGLLSAAHGLDAHTICRRGAGAHVCHFYRNAEDLAELVPAYFAEGVASGERGVWALPPWLSAARAEKLLGDQGLGSAIADGALALRPHTEVYARADGRLRPSHEVVGYWSSQQARALSDGFRGLRICGDGTCWNADDQEWRAFLAYERSLAPTLAGSRVVALCTFAVAEVSPERLVEALTAGHDCGLVRRADGWDEMPNAPGALAAMRLFAAGVA